MDLNSEYVRNLAADFGADLCGIAPIDRFEGAPEGFHPRDVLPGCRSVVVLACRFLKSTLVARSTIPYTDVRNRLTRKMDDLAIGLSYALESNGAVAVPVNAIGPTEWNDETQKSMGIISLKHAAVRAGLGKMGKNTLLVNEKYGNMIWLSAVLTSIELDPDSLARYDTCPPDCTICLDACPIGALDGVSIDQSKCWNFAFGTHNGGEWRIKCFACRKACPNCLGIGQKP